MNWAPDEIETLRAEYGRVLAATIARRLGRSVGAVKKKAERLGLQSDNFKARHAKGSDHPNGYAVGAVWQACGRMWTRTAKDGKARSLARVVLERNGVDPRGRVVVHLDGDRLNCKPENLKALTRAQNVVRNNGRCADKELRSARISTAKSGDSFLDFVLKGGFV